MRPPERPEWGGRIPPAPPKQYCCVRRSRGSYFSSRGLLLVVVVVHDLIVGIHHIGAGRSAALLGLAAHVGAGLTGLAALLAQALPPEQENL